MKTREDLGFKCKAAHQLIKWSLNVLLTLIASGKCTNSFLTMEMWPPRIAAYNGVHLVLLWAVHFAPAFIKQSTCSAYPFWQALVNEHNFFELFSFFHSLDRYPLSILHLSILQWCKKNVNKELPTQTYMNNSELSSFGAKLTTSSLSKFKSLIMRLVMLTLFSRIALRNISYSAVSCPFAINANQSKWTKRENTRNIDEITFLFVRPHVC